MGCKFYLQFKFINISIILFTLDNARDMRTFVDCSVLINLDNKLDTICTLWIVQKRNGICQMSCKEISWLCISGLLFLKEKIFLNQKQVIAEGVKESRNGKSSTALGLAWKKNSKGEVGLLIDRMYLCSNLGLFVFLLWWDLSHLCRQLHLGLVALIPLLRCLFIDFHAIFRKEVLTSSLSLLLCST